MVAAAIVCVLGYFLIGIKDTSHENRSDVTIGTVAVRVIVLSGVAFVFVAAGTILRIRRAAGSGQQVNKKLSRTRRPSLFHRCAGDAERQIDFVGNLVFHLTRLDVEVGALDVEVRADHEQVPFHVRHALAEFCPSNK